MNDRIAPSPILLPWLAKKAGISERRAQRLWTDALLIAGREAEANSSVYFMVAVDKWMALVARDSLEGRRKKFPYAHWRGPGHVEMGPWVYPWHLFARSFGCGRSE